jgi:hypothetical protein
MEHKDKQEIIGKKNKVLCHLVKHQKKYLILLLLIIWSIPLLTNLANSEPVIKGAESYYHLSQAKEITINNFYYWPLNFLSTTFPDQSLIFIPLILAISSILLLIAITKKTNFTERSTFFYLSLTILSPAFIWTFTTLSAYSVQIFLTLLGFYLLSRDKQISKIFSIIPFILATFFDTFSSLILISLLLVYWFYEKKATTIVKTILGTTIVLTIINSLLLKLSFMLGPFNQQELVSGLITDLGGLSGMSLFTILIGLIGFTITWKKKGFYFAYLLLPLVLIPYFFNTNMIIYLSLLTTFFATVGLTKLFERNWQVVSLKKFTFFILILGLLFSTLTYVERVSMYQPTEDITETLFWVKENLPNQEVIFSSPENSYFIKYFTNKEPTHYVHQSTKKKENLFQNISHAFYVTELFPLLEENNISIIYVTKDMKEQLSEEMELLFLLKNERFKIVHSHEGTEVWVFVPSETEEE